MSDQTNGVAPPSSITETPTEAPLAFTSVATVAVSVTGFRATIAFRAWITWLVALVEAAVIGGIRRFRLVVRLGVVVVACTSLPTSPSAMKATAATATATDTRCTTEKLLRIPRTLLRPR